MAYTSKRYALGADVTVTGLNQIAGSAVGDVRALQRALNRFAGAGFVPLPVNGVFDELTMSRTTDVLVKYAADAATRGGVAPELVGVLSLPIMTSEQRSTWIIARLALIVATLNGYANMIGLPGDSSSRAWMWGVAAAGVAILLFGKKGRR